MPRHRGQKVVDRLNQNQKAEIDDMFDRLDPQKDGWVSAEKIMAALASIEAGPLPSEAAVAAVVRQMTKGARHAHHRANHNDFLDWMANDFMNSPSGHTDPSASMHGGLILTQTGSRLWDLLVVFRRKQMLNDVQQGGKARLAVSDLFFVRAHPDRSGLTTPQLSFVPSSPGASPGRHGQRNRHGMMSMKVPTSPSHHPHANPHPHHQQHYQPDNHPHPHSHHPDPQQSPHPHPHPHSHLHHHHHSTPSHLSNSSRSTSPQPGSQQRSNELHPPLTSHEEQPSTPRVTLGAAGSLSGRSPPDHKPRISSGLGHHHPHHHDLVAGLEGPGGSRKANLTGMSRLGMSSLDLAESVRQHEEPAWSTPGYGGLQRLSFGGTAVSHELQARMLWHGLGAGLLPDPAHPDIITNQHPLDVFRSTKPHSLRVPSHLGLPPQSLDKEWLPDAVSPPAFMQVDLPRDAQTYQLDLQLLPTSPTSVLSDAQCSPLAVARTPSRPATAAARPRSAIINGPAAPHGLACPAVCDAVSKGEAPLAQAAIQRATQAHTATFAQQQRLKDLAITKYFKQLSGLAVNKTGQADGVGRPASRASMSHTTSSSQPECCSQQGLRSTCTPSPTTQKLLLQLPQALRSSAVTPPPADGDQQAPQNITPGPSIPDPRPPLVATDTLAADTTSKPAGVESGRLLTPGSRACHRQSSTARHVVTLDVMGCEADDPLVQGLPSWLQQEVSKQTLKRRQDPSSSWVLEDTEGSITLHANQQSEVLPNPKLAVSSMFQSTGMDEFDMEVAAAMGLSCTDTQTPRHLQCNTHVSDVGGGQGAATTSTASTSTAATPFHTNTLFTDWTPHYIFAQRPKTSQGFGAPQERASSSLRCSGAAARFVLSGSGQTAKAPARVPSACSPAPVSVRLTKAAATRMQHVLRSSDSDGLRIAHYPAAVLHNKHG